MMPRNIFLLTGFVGLAGLGLAACGSSSIADRKRPDEFAVGRQAPLVVPPDYSLAPPRPGAPRPLATTSQQQAMEALLGSEARLPPPSEIENKLLDDAGATRTDPAIRNTAGDQPGGDETSSVDKGVFLRELLDAQPQTRNAEIARVTVGG